jgi:serine protease inhibitor
MKRLDCPMFAVPLLLAILAGCDGSPSDPGEPERAFTVDETLISRANTGFGLELFSRVQHASEQPNVMVSPLSASMALGMTANGARDATLEAMRDVLGLGGLPEDSVNAAYRGLMDQLRARDRKVEFRLANSIWYERTFPFESAFIDQAKKTFDAEVSALDFASPSSPGTISRWAEDATGGRIRDLVQSIDPAEVMFLVNAVYFKAPWSTPFEPNGTSDQPFRRADGSTVLAHMMHGDATRPTFVQDGIQAVEMLYADSSFGMVVLMPTSGTLDGLIATLTPERWQQIIEGLQPGRIMLSLPKFRFEFGEKLNDALTAMGMGIAFDDRADFGRMTKQHVIISRVEHKTFIDVHELGTEAAAATSVGVSVTSLPPSITFDRPFLFAIRERESGTILFIGRVGDPLASGG